jgi:hypothetical protein
MHSDTYLYCKRALILALLLAGGGAFSSLRAQVGLGLSPMRLDLNFGTNRFHSGTLTLSTSAPERMRVRAEILDFFIDASETPQFDRNLPQESPYSCRQWLALNPMEAEIEPKNAVPVRYTIRLPEGLPEGSYHCAAGFTTFPRADQLEGMGVRTAVRVVAVFYVVVGTPKIEGGFQEIKLEPVKDSNHPAWRGVVVLKNPGRRHFRPTGELTVVDAGGNAVETVPFRSLPVLPNRQQRFLFPLKALQTDQQYRLRARVDIGTAEILEGTAAVTAHATPP